MERLIKTDVKCSRLVFDWNKKSSLSQTIVKLYNVSSDEGLWFGISLLSMVLFVVVRPFKDLELYKSSFPISESTQQTLMIVMNEVFGWLCVAASFEQVLKYIFKRQRPSYGKRRTDWSILWENYSFPSGHTLRAAYLLQCFQHSRVLKHVVPGFFLMLNAHPLGAIFTGWDVFVGFSRVAAGKHYIFDTFCGLILGIYWGQFVEKDSSNQIFCYVRAAAKFNIGTQFWFLAVEREIRKLKLGNLFLRAFQIFYFVFLFITVKESFPDFLQ